MLIEHLTAETRVRTEGNGRTLDEWSARPNRRENHWWDCLVGAAAAASIQGVAFDAVASGPAKREKVSLSEIQRRKFQQQGRKTA